MLTRRMRNVDEVDIPLWVGLKVLLRQVSKMLFAPWHAIVQTTQTRQLGTRAGPARICKSTRVCA